MSASCRSTSSTRMVLVLIHTAPWRRWETLTSIRTGPSSSRHALTQVTWMTSVLDRAICSFSFYTLNTAAVYASLKMVGNFSAVDLGCSHGMCNEYFIISIENDCFTVDQSCSDETNLPVSVWRLRDHAAAHACTYMYIHVHVWHCADPAFQRLILFLYTSRARVEVAVLVAVLTWAHPRASEVACTTWRQEKTNLTACERNTRS